MLSVHVDYVFMEGRPKTMENIKYMIKLNLNIQESSKLKKFLGVYYEWGHDDKGQHTKITIDKDVKKLVYGYDKFTGSHVKVLKTPGVPGTTLCKRELK